MGPDPVLSRWRKAETARLFCSFPCFTETRSSRFQASQVLRDSRCVSETASPPTTFCGPLHKKESWWTATADSLPHWRVACANGRLGELSLACPERVRESVYFSRENEEGGATLSSGVFDRVTGVSRPLCVGRRWDGEGRLDDLTTDEGGRRGDRRAWPILPEPSALGNSPLN